MQSGISLHHNRNWSMKIPAFLLFSLVSMTSYAQNNQVQNVIGLNPSASGNLLDTSNMYKSPYGAVARLTPDNMPCIIPDAFSVPIPNAAKNGKRPVEIPNFWKGAPWKYRGKPNKYLPVPEIRLQPKKF